MNYIQHLNGFFNRIKNDPRLSALHVSLYIALFQYWNYNRFQGPFPVFRDKVMQLCKIGSKNTYHKCIKGLHEAGYIRYHPPLSKFYPAKVSIVRLDVGNPHQQQPGLFDATPADSMFKPSVSPSPISANASTEIETNASIIFDTHSTETGIDTSTGIDTDSVSRLTATGTNFDTATGPDLGHSIKPNSKQTERALSLGIFKKSILGHGGNEPPGATKIVPAKNSCLSIAWSAAMPRPAETAQNQVSQQPPAYPDVWAYFVGKKYPDVEAEKFYNHYQAIGWKIQGVTPIRDWKALADKWMLNAQQFNRAAQAGPAGSTPHIHTKTDKNYDEPL